MNVRGTHPNTAAHAAMRAGDARKPAGKSSVLLSVSAPADGEGVGHRVEKFVFAHGVGRKIREPVHAGTTLMSGPIRAHAAAFHGKGEDDHSAASRQFDARGRIHAFEFERRM